MFNLLKNMVRREVNACLTPNTKEPPIGYNPAEVIRGALFNWVQVPVNGTYIWCKLRCLNGAQAEVCGKVTLVELLKQKETVKDFDKLAEIRNIQENLCRAVLVYPSFNEIEKIIFDEDTVIQDKRDRLAELKKVDLSSLPKEQKAELVADMEKEEMFISFLLPEDMFAFLTSWALCVDVSDIKKVNKDMLLEAGLLARAGHDNPVDHLSGVFTDRDPSDLNKAAWTVVADYDKQREIARKAKRGK